MSAPAIMRLQLGKTQALVTSPTGASHLDKGLPCQDACMVSQQFYRGQPYMVLAVADGHGSEKYSRSDIGSHLAMEAVHQAATELVMALVDAKEKHPTNWLQYVRKDINQRFQQNLINIWKQKVIAHATEYPEPNVIADSEVSMSRYGTTVVVAISFDGWLIFGGLGDSAIYVVYENNNTLTAMERLATTKDSNSVGLGTDSMISSHAVYAWRTEIMQEITALPQGDLTLKMLLLTSDGMPDSLTDPKKSVQSIYENTQAQGIDWLQSILPQQLAQWSKDGVGDDMGMVLLFPNSSQTAINTPSTPDQTKETTS